MHGVASAPLQAAGLPPKYAAELTKIAKRNTHVLLASSVPRSARSPVDWTPLHGNTPVDGVQMYAGVDPKRSKELPPLNIMCGVGYIHAPLDDVVHAFCTQETNPYFKRFVDDPVVIDTRTVYDMEKQGRRATSIQWLAIRSSTSFMQHRDFVVVQHQDEMPASDRKEPRTWVSCMHSVNLPMVPPFDNSYVRGGIYSSGFVLRETPQRGVTEAVFVLKVDFKGMAPRVFCSSTLKSWVACVGRIALYFQHHRGVGGRRHRRSVDDDVRLPRVHRNQEDRDEGCALCHEPFGVRAASIDFGVGPPLVADRESCRKCLRRVCSLCTTWADVDLEVVGRINVLVCKPCAATEAAAQQQCQVDDTVSSMSVDVAALDRLVLDQHAPTKKTTPPSLHSRVLQYQQAQQQQQREQQKQREQQAQQQKQHEQQNQRPRPITFPGDMPRSSLAVHVPLTDDDNVPVLRQDNDDEGDAFRPSRLSLANDMLTTSNSADDIPMRPSTATWLDTLTRQQTHQGKPKVPSKKPMHDPRNQAAPSFVDSTSPQDQYNRPRQSSLPEKQLSASQGRLAHRFVGRQPHSLLDSGSSLLVHHPSSPPPASISMFGHTPSTKARASYIQLGRRVSNQPQPHDRSQPNNNDDDDDDSSVIQAFTSTGSVLDLDRDVASFRL
ncbi:Aste57867_6934 [Aphanomyces stellatus]|uniref:Aste57867_6934 protein n=1 Tax=Aphanomyces stellatus TaxID=120398 RepID=A0A485KGR8_9STRA|nr:hypothetical protein As57867_006912 [Aphanomyces stellatus]VFT83886.1 Aste57867_6934 [Aphanomyces stellatus]